MRSKEKGFYIAAMAVLTAVIVVLVVLAALIRPAKSADSEIYIAMKAYGEGDENWDAALPENMAESLFAVGVRAYDMGDYVHANECFEASLKSDSDDPTLDAYTYRYLCLTEYALNGECSVENAESALAAIRSCPMLINDKDFIWDIADSLYKTSSHEAAELLERHLDKVEGMELSTWAWTKNCIGLIAYYAEEYSRSIRSFYDVEIAASESEMTHELEAELLYAREYIANIRFLFEDYEGAVELYSQLLEYLPDTAVLETVATCINMGSAYIALEDADGARRTMETLESLLPQADPQTAPDIWASMNEVLASVCIMEGRLEEADAHLREAEAYYKNGGEGLFLGGERYLTMTRAEYLLKAGDPQSAEELLKPLVAGGAEGSIGVEKEALGLLKDVYKATGQTDKLAEVYERMLEADEEFMRTTRREYLEFSEYYRENYELRLKNTNLSRYNQITFVVALIVAAALIAVLILVKLLRSKNVTDPLTGVFNRKRLSQLQGAFKRRGTPARFAVLMADIDYFKRYNDTKGHVAGDEVLKKVAGVILDSVRAKDVVMRYGGEEFMVAVRGVDRHTALAVCGRIKARLAKEAIPHGASDADPCVTLSIGFCHQDKANESPLEVLIERADKALYASKEAGRNTITGYSDEN